MNHAEPPEMVLRGSGQSRFGLRLVAFAVAALLSAICLSAPAGAAPGGLTPAGTPDTPGATTDSGPSGSSNKPVGQVQTTTSPCGVSTDGDGSDAAHSALGSTTGVISQFAIMGLCWTLARIDIGTSPSIEHSNGGWWFSDMYSMFRGIALWVMIPILLISTIQAVFKGSLFHLVKSYLVLLPVSVVGGVIGVSLTQLLINITDDFSKGFLDSIAANAMYVFAGVADGFGAHGLEAGIPYFVTIICGFLLGCACIGVYLILLLREASTYVAALFIPLTLAFLIWPSTGHFIKKLAEFLLGLIFSKLVMVAGISLAVAAMASTTGATANANNTTTAPDGGKVNDGGITAGSTGSGSAPWYTWLGQTMTTTLMMGIVCFAPNMTVKLFANVGLGSMGRHVSDHASNQNLSRHLVFIDRNLTTATQLKNYRQAGRELRARQEWANNNSEVGVALAANGVEADVNGSYQIDADAIADAGITDPGVAADIYNMSRSQNANDINMAHQLLQARATSWGFDRFGNAIMMKPGPENGGRGEAVLVADIVDRGTNQVRYGMNVNSLRNSLENLANPAGGGAGYQDIRVIVPYGSVVQDHSTGNAAFADNRELANANSLQNVVRDVNQRYGTRAGLVYDATTTITDVMNATSAGSGRGGGRL